MKVTCVITTFVPENKRYLDACIQSIKNLKFDGDIDIVLVGKKSYQPQYEMVETIAPDTDDFYCTHGLNMGMNYAAQGILRADGKLVAPDYLFYMNDDVVLTKDCLTAMVWELKAFKDHGIANGISPCDGYPLAFAIKDESNENYIQLTKRFTRYEEVSKVLPQMMNAHSFYPQGHFRPEFLCTFATLFPLKVWLDLGGYDENFKGGPDDIDICFRAKEKTYPLLMVTNALIWHFGGVSTERTNNPQGTVSERLRHDNDTYFLAKWNRLPPGCDEGHFKERKMRLGIN